MSSLFTLCFTLSTAWAVDDLDGDRAEERSRARASDSDIVREIERGYFLKGGAGVTTYVGAYGPLLSPVMALNLGVGQDFIDKERMSVAWEVVFNQALLNGPKEDALAGLPGVAPLIQGDIHTFSGLALVEASAYVTRRFGLGVRAGGGVMMVPVLMFDGAEVEGYTDTVVNGYWGGATSNVHNGLLPVVGGGPTLEYYTKLSHFSVGVDADITYVIGFDLAVSPYGYLKYTF